MVPRAQGESPEGTHNIGNDIIKVKRAAIRYDALQEFRADAQNPGADQESEV